MILILGGGGIAEGIVKLFSSAIIADKSDCDVRDLEAVTELIESVQPDVVINCAGVSRPAGVSSSDKDDWLEEVDVNLVGSYNIAKACPDAMLIFIASVAGLYGKPNHSGYSASKAGVISLVQSLGMEGYNAYAISPGRVNTPMRQRDYPDDKPGSRLEVSEIADLINLIIEGEFEPGDNIVIRKIGLKTMPIKVDKGEPWRTELKVGRPKTI